MPSRYNGYFDAWCHLRDDVPNFSLDAIQRISILYDAAKEATTLDKSISNGYGTFGGNPMGCAKMRFNPERARWVAGERWHRNQGSKTFAGGSYVLKIPYPDERHLVGYLLLLGADVEVPAGC